MRIITLLYQQALKPLPLAARRRADISKPRSWPVTMTHEFRVCPAQAVEMIVGLSSAKSKAMHQHCQATQQQQQQP
jgi:hypothetical protein